MRKREKYVAGTQIEWNVGDRRFFRWELRLSLPGFLIVLMLNCIIGLSAFNVFNEGTTQRTEMVSVSPITVAMPEEVPEEVTAKEVPEEATRVVAKVTGSDSAYIRRFQRVAILEMEKFGIPASISMAQGILESGSGGGYLAEKANNHFGIKCKSRNCSRGHCINRHDDSHKDFFLIYGSAWESWRHHSKLLSDPDWRYAKLIDGCDGDYKCWARGLKKAGYATDPRYAEKLIRIIERYQLYRLDKGRLIFG